MRPALGSRNLVSRLKTVVLPAPFGPINAWIVPRRTWRPTPRTAANPRNSLVRPWVSRIRSGTCSTTPTRSDAGPLLFSWRRHPNPGRRGLTRRCATLFWVFSRRRATMDAIEQALGEIKFDADGLLPAIAQQHDTGEVLMVAWMNREAIRATLEEGWVCYWSRSRGRLW